ncbi:CO/xanthine dehydrogenase FAD-binding subunit [Bacillus niacini]|uniref:CO/xanthine dehydrogenase FAD-binding subunit n=1 Tax=Neobacillus niacini TaxID=86668 RepID=A0A852TG26_9BACI|nr:xanthine dehydrogenase family protein subunit M [Neobacillus niacini]NYE07059.1 CO/xanthine dehydrogenase FAD-binding subunit [Neobacillus niacini]
MKPPKFSYLRPNSLQEALDMLAEYGDDAKIMSGGQSLIPLLNMRLSTPGYIIDIGRVEELKGIREEEDVIVIGGMTRHVDVEKSALVREKCPLLTEGITWVGHNQIRSRGTIGGSIAHADPSAELPCMLTALRGEIVIMSREEEITVSPEEFFLSYLLTSLEPNQLIKEIRFPKIKKGSGYAFEEVARRHGDFALVEVAAVVELEADGTIADAKIALGGANSVPFIPEAVEGFLIGKMPDDSILKEAATLQLGDLDPEGDIHGSKEYRRYLSGVLLERALYKAIARAREGVFV